MLADFFSTLWCILTRRHKVRIHYTSGHEVTFTCKKFTWKGVNEGLTDITWSHARPEPLFAHISQIESIWKIR